MTNSTVICFFLSKSIFELFNVQFTDQSFDIILCITLNHMGNSSCFPSFKILNQPLMSNFKLLFLANQYQYIKLITDLSSLLFRD